MQSEKKKNKYFFRFISPTRLTGSSWATHQKWEQQLIKINYPEENTNMIVFDKRIEKGGVYLHYGLGFDIELYAEDKEKAEILAKERVFNFLTLVTYLESCYAGLPIIILSYKKTDRNLWLEDYYGLVIDNSYRPVETSLRPINFLQLNEFIEKIKNLTPEIIFVINEALHWFWKALDSNDLRDRFINLWISLEFLEQPLKQKFNLPTSKIKKQPICLKCEKAFSTKCPHCKEEYYYLAPIGKAGYKKLEKGITENVMKFEELHAFRSSLFHPSIKASKKTNSDYRQAIYSARVLLNYAIALLLELDTRKISSLAKLEMRAISLPAILEFIGRVRMKKDITIDDIDKQPSVIGDYKFRYKFEEEDIIPLVDVKHTFQGEFEVRQVKKIVKIDSSHNVKEIWERKEVDAL